ncbi:MAG: hypothetical protein EXS05_19225 [Planctomycetaceae bacterium]|nr:hypothetical protein [Planctomycetaceae bacterium]
MTALLVYPTHKNCREVEEDYLAAGISAATYPGRTTEESDEMPQNCWNEDADRAEGMGLPVVKTVCPSCKSRQKCLACGYLGELIAAQDATVALCTHKRAEYTSLLDMTNGRQYVSIHENPIDLLRPAVPITEQDLFIVQRIVSRIVTDPESLDWFGNDIRIDDEGNRYHDEEQTIRRDREYQFCLHLIELIDALVSALEQAEITTEWQSKAAMKCATGIERTLFKATRAAQATFQGQAWRFVLAAASGELHSAAILVETRFVKGGGQGNGIVLKSVNGFKHNPPSTGAVTWFNDATLARERLEMILGRPVQDMTPGGRIERRQKAVQILRDITRAGKPRIFANYLRGVLADRPQSQRVGVICHRPHVTAAKSLGAEFDQRIVKVTYFGSGEDRSSNDWYEQCDLIVVAGTPRIRPGAIASYLIQVGEVGAACRVPDWVTVYWEGQNESGEPIKVSSRGYDDEAWRAAHRDLVRAQMVQAIGRGRGILETGCAVVVLSAEECGLPISDAGMESLNGGSTKVLEAMRRLTMENPKEHYLGKSIVSTREVANATGLSLVRTRELLRGLERRGLARKAGERLGWALVVPAHKVPAPCPA